MVCMYKGRIRIERFEKVSVDRTAFRLMTRELKESIENTRRRRRRRILFAFFLRRRRAFRLVDRFRFLLTAAFRSVRIGDRRLAFACRPGRKRRLQKNRLRIVFRRDAQRLRVRRRR